MDRNTGDRLRKIRSSYDAMASAYASEISGELRVGMSYSASMSARKWCVSMNYGESQSTLTLHFLTFMN